MSEKNVLVTGANGHVGYTLTKMLFERGYNVRASVRDKENKELTKNLSEFDIEIVSLDLMKPETIEPAMDETEFLYAIKCGLDAVPKHADLLCIGEMGIGNTTSAAAICLALF